jgi:hypothetical protein
MYSYQIHYYYQIMVHNMIKIIYNVHKKHVKIIYNKYNKCKLNIFHH